VREKPGSGKYTDVRRDEDQPPGGYLHFRQENWPLIPGWPQVFIRHVYLPPRISKSFSKTTRGKQIQQAENSYQKIETAVIDYVTRPN